MKKVKLARANGSQNSPGKQPQKTRGKLAARRFSIVLPNYILPLLTEAAKKEGTNRKEFILRAIRGRELHQSGPAPQPALPAEKGTSGIFPLENEIYAVASLVDLMTEELTDYQSDCDDENKKHAAAGTLVLADRTISGLWKAFNAALQYYRPAAPAAKSAVSAEAGKGGAK